MWPERQAAHIENNKFHLTTVSKKKKKRILELIELAAKSASGFPHLVACAIILLMEFASSFAVSTNESWNPIQINNPFKQFWEKKRSTKNLRDHSIPVQQLTLQQFSC